MNFLHYMVDGLAILGIIPSIIGMVRYGALERRYLPLVLFVWASFGSDCINYFTGKYLRTNAPNQDIYTIVEFAIVVWIFWRWRLFRGRRGPLALLTVASLMWIWETFIYKSLWDFNSITHSTLTFVQLLLAIQYINKLIVTEQKLTLANSDFLACIAFIFLFAAASVTEVFWLFSYSVGSQLANRVYDIMSYANIISNLTFALALLCAPKKQKFLQLSSFPLP